jgi:type III pantothenate kinase
MPCSVLTIENQTWLALMIGNSRSHWALFLGDTLHHTWDTPHPSPDAIQQFITYPHALLSLSPSPPLPLSLSPLTLWIASVVPEHSDRWHPYPQAQFITLEQVPLQHTYPTLGIDRALAVWGAITTVGSPVLVIDAGTALTFTGVDRQNCLVGGAILPGVGLQLQALNQGTAALPRVVLQAPISVSPPLPPPLSPSSLLPHRWAQDTQGAIVSGILYTLVAGIRDFVADWWQQFPDSPVLLTGGDRDLLHGLLREQFPDFASRIALDANLIFLGMRSMRQKLHSKG